MGFPLCRTVLGILSPVTWKEKPLGWGCSCHPLRSTLIVTSPSLPLPSECERIRGLPTQSLDLGLLWPIPSLQLTGPCGSPSSNCVTEQGLLVGVVTTMLLLLFSPGQRHPCQVPSGGYSSLSPASCESRAAKEERGASHRVAVMSHATLAGSQGRACVFYEAGTSELQSGKRAKGCPRPQRVPDSDTWHSPNCISWINICFCKILSSVSLRELF